MWTSRRTFREQCNKICSVADFSGTLGVLLILCSQQVARQIVRIDGDTAGTAAAAPFSWEPPRGRQRRADNLCYHSRTCRKTSINV
jgi:hypothetical protein